MQRPIRLHAHARVQSHSALRTPSSAQRPNALLLVLVVSLLRRWLTQRFLKNWLNAQAYYRIQLDQSITDNPDQRISDDLDRYTSLTLSLSLGLLDSLVTLLSFLFILWQLSRVLTIPLWGGGSFELPGYLVIVAFLYAVIGSWLTHWVGSPLAGLIRTSSAYSMSAPLCSPLAIAIRDKASAPRRSPADRKPTSRNVADTSRLPIG